jgi:hypothetical protein
LHGGHTQVVAAGMGIDEIATAAAIRRNTRMRGLRRNWIMALLSLLAARLSRAPLGGLERN